MTTKRFTEGAETLNENVKTTMKWFQDATSAFMEVQNKQLKVANDLYSKTLNDYLGKIKNENFNSSFEAQKEMMEVLKKNAKDYINNSNAAIKKLLEFGKQKDSFLYSSDILKKVSETFNEQMEKMTAVNKKYFDNFFKQFNTSESIKPSFDNLKTAFDINFNSSKKTMQEIVDSYAKQSPPTLEVNKKMLDDLNNNMTKMAENNFKLWSELLSNANKSSSKNGIEKNGVENTKTPKTK